MDDRYSIVSDPLVMMGKPVIAGTRITVELILEKLELGGTTEQILSAHPRLTNAAISAALGFEIHPRNKGFSKKPLFLSVSKRTSLILFRQCTHLLIYLSRNFWEYLFTLSISSIVAKYS
jgi:uncharacterized protein (DUF433 family)